MIIINLEYICFNEVIQTFFRFSKITRGNADLKSSPDFFCSSSTHGFLYYEYLNICQNLCTEIFIVCTN